MLSIYPNPQKQIQNSKKRDYIWGEGFNSPQKVEKGERKMALRGSHE